MTAPDGMYPFAGVIQKRVPLFKATGEYRNPNAGEYYLSGAAIEAYQAYFDMASPYWIAREIQLDPCPHCNGTGKIERKQ